MICEIVNKRHIEKVCFRKRNENKKLNDNLLWNIKNENESIILKIGHELIMIKVSLAPMKIINNISINDRY